MKQIMLYYLIITLLILNSYTLNPPIWPQRFTQSATVNFGDIITTGKFWYDSVQNSQRFDFQNGNSKSGCGQIHPGNTPCTYLNDGKWDYMIFPQKNLCCLVYEQQMTSRDWLKDYTYFGEQDINGQMFNVWQLFNGTESLMKYYADKSQQSIPRRQYSGGVVFLDYWINSYSQKQINPSVFNVPSYCKKRCWEIVDDPNKIEKIKEQINFFKIKTKSKLEDKILTQ